MTSKLKKILIPFVIMIIVHYALTPDLFMDLGILAPHVGLYFVIGMLLGPYGALGAASANIILDLLDGFTLFEIIPSAIFSFGVSCLAYKLWYSGIKTDKVTKPALDNIYHLTLFLSILIVCGFIYSTFHANLLRFILSPEIDEFFFVSYLMNFVNLGFIFGIVGILISKKTNFIEIPKPSKRQVNKKLYKILFYSLLIVSIILTITTVLNINQNIVIGEMIIIPILLFTYLTKPFEHEIQQNDENTIVEKIIRNFIIITMAIAILGVVISVISHSYVDMIDKDNIYLMMMPTLIITDIIIILFFVPGMIILRYIEDNVLKPISSFSEIEAFINENEKIESDGLVEIYSKYIHEQDEIGTLARSYTELINHNNNYIENIREIEGEKERINAELDIATKIQAAALPTEAIENDEFIVNGYSRPAKEVGGDFFDYYMIDEDNLAIVIGDASGKGVPAAIIAMITQVTIKQILLHDQDPSKVLYLLNNQLCENNPESMFLTLWLGIYNKTTKKITFSNAGHNPPIIKENCKFKYLDIDTGLVLGIIEDFDYVREEITLTDELILYTDGITDANNEDNKMYGEDRLLNFFNEFKGDKDPIRPLLNDIHDFSGNTEQYDDMTLLYLKLKD